MNESNEENIKKKTKHNCQTCDANIERQKNPKKKSWKNETENETAPMCLLMRLCIGLCAHISLRIY